MPSRAKKLERDVARQPSIPKELVEHFLTGPMSGEAINAIGGTVRISVCEARFSLAHHWAIDCRQGVAALARP
ncbi:MAG: hypothetical protein ACRD1A_14045 [Terriglobales bacterium]